MHTLMPDPAVVEDDLLAEYDRPVRGRVMLRVELLRMERSRAVVRVKGSAENGHVEIFDVSPQALIDHDGDLQIEGELVDCHRHPGRFLAMYLTGEVVLAELPGHLTVPMGSLIVAQSR